jgi:quercetin dioxygenase-like cupin family protein
MEGYVFEGADGTQLVLWTNETGQGYSAPHSHDFDEYCVVLSGRFTGLVDGKPVDVGPGEELHIPAGVVHEGGYTMGYRAIDGFGGRRVKHKEDGR